MEHQGETFLMNPSEPSNSTEQRPSPEQEKIMGYIRRNSGKFLGNHQDPNHFQLKEQKQAD
jgi:hypothetical protein